jgi:hypothetical protein
MHEVMGMEPMIEHIAVILGQALPNASLCTRPSPSNIDGASFVYDNAGNRTSKLNVLNGGNEQTATTRYISSRRCCRT